LSPFASALYEAVHEAVHAGEIAPDVASDRQLQADVFVTLDAELARRVDGIVSTATIEALRTA
jgi:formaldehyde-activating enzyme involved in methanogenesis